MSSDLICAAQRLFPDAEHFIPVRGDKRPLCPGWNDSGYSATELAQFSTNPNFRAVGVNLARARNLLCVDVDDASGWALIQQQGLDTPDTLQIGRTGDPDRVKLFYSLTPAQADALQQHNLGGKTKRPGLDLFWASGQVVVTGRHPAGEYHDNDHPIAALPDGWIQWLITPTPTPTPTPAAPAPGSVRLVTMLTGKNAEHLRSGFTTGSRNHQLFAFAADAFAAQAELQRRGASISGPDAEALIQEALSHTDQTDFSPTEIADTIASARAGRSPSIGFDRRLEYATGTKAAPDLYAPFSGLPWGMQDDGERQRPSRSNAHIALQHFKALGNLWFDELRQVEMLGQQQLTDHHLMLAEAAYAANGWALGYDPLCRAVIGAARSNPRHPIREYLQGVSGPASDDVWHNLDKHLLGIDDDMARYYLPRFLVGAVARAFDPGAPVRHVPLLIGGQEVGKTTLAEHLFGSSNYSSVNLEGQSKDSLAICHQNWCIELSELDGITKRRDCESLKTFISTNVDTYRPPFGRLTITKPRGFVFWATSNSAPLNDPTGSTRFVAIRVGDELLPLDWVKANRDALWARAVVEYRAGFNWTRFDELHRALQATRNAQEQVEDDWADLIADRVRIHGNDPIPKQTVYAWLEIPKERQGPLTARRIRLIMEGLGRRSGRQHGLPRAWMVPEPDGGATTIGGTADGTPKPSDSNRSQPRSTSTTKNQSLVGIKEARIGGTTTHPLPVKRSDLGGTTGTPPENPAPATDLPEPQADPLPQQTLDLVRQIHAEQPTRSPDAIAHLLAAVGGPTLDPQTVAKLIS